MDLIEAMYWRYATKRYVDRELPEGKLQEILEAINLAATSTGIQPYRLFLVKDAETREKIGADSSNKQIVEASELLVFAAFDSVTQKHIDEYIERTADIRGVATESLGDFKEMLENNFLTKTDAENFKWAAKQAYIALGTGLIAAANLKVDASPMEGFSPEKVDTLLRLKEKGLKSVVLLALGYRDEKKDRFSGLKKVRLPIEELVTEIGYS